jgi:hypothetical protein
VLADRVGGRDEPVARVVERLNGLRNQSANGPLLGERAGGEKTLGLILVRAALVWASGCPEPAAVHPGGDGPQVVLFAVSYLHVQLGRDHARASAARAHHRLAAVEWAQGRKLEFRSELEFRSKSKLRPGTKTPQPKSAVAGPDAPPTTTTDRTRGRVL